MQRTTILISITLATAILGLFFLRTRMNQQISGATHQGPGSLASVQPNPKLKQEGTTIPSPPSAEDSELNSASTTPLPVETITNLNAALERLPNPAFQAKEQSSATPKSFKPAHRPKNSPRSGNVTQEPSIDEPAEHPPIVVPLDLNNPNSSATLPAVLIESLPSENFTPQQLAGINKLTEDFIKAVTDPTIPQDPKNPEYQQRWRSAQVTADDLFRTRYGDYAWMQRHNAAHREILLKGGK